VDLSDAPADLAAAAAPWVAGGLAPHGRAALLSDEPAWREDALLELLLEPRRPEGAPSRLRSLYAFCTVTDAQQFRDSHRDPSNGIFEVVGPADAPRFDARLLGIASSPLVTAIYADWYWAGRANPLGDPLWEVLLALPVTIGARVG
jgi:hypothetical protein